MAKTVAFIVAVIATIHLSEQKDIRMGKVNGVTDCGDVIHMHEGDSSTVISGSPIPSGYCGILIHAMDNSDHFCSGVCFKVNSQKASDCHSISSITAVKFGKNQESPRTLSCFSTYPSDWCVDATTVRIETIRDMDYIASAYEFNITVTVSCLSKDDHASNLLDTEEAKRKKDAEKAHETTIKGLIAGICLAVAFLIILLITWCYYKNRPFRGTRYDYPSKSHKKGLNLSNMKEKFRTNKCKRDSEKADGVEKKSSVKKEESAPLVEGAAAASTSADDTVEVIDEKAEESDKKEKEEAEPTEGAQSVPEVKVDEPTPVSDDGEKTENA